MILGLLAVAVAAPEEVWVELRDGAARARAHAAGFGWAEGQDGDFYRLAGTPAMAEAAGLPWRAVAAAVDGYAPDPDDIDARLDALAADGRAEVVQIGESVDGAPILALRIGDGPRALRVLGGHHGDETSSVMVALAVAEAYATGAAPLPAGTELWVVPDVNPDGVRAGTRVNASGIDLNRNYGWQWTAGEASGGPSPFSEPETRAIRALARARSFDAGLSLHAGASNLGWVWNWTSTERAPEEPLLEALAAAYAADCTAPDFWITNGADWYVTHGDTTDWTYGVWGAYDYTLELTTDKAPPEDEVATYTAWHLAAIEAWIARPADRAATVVDDTTGEPVAASIAGDGVRAAWTGPGGTFARWAADPAAPLTVSAPGYADAPLADETRLVPDTLLATLPEPRLLSRGAGAQAVTLAGAGTGALRLTQPGEVDVLVPADGPGTWTIDPAALAPGAWTLVTDAGVVPRGLFVGEVSDRVVLDGASLADGVLTVRGAGFGRGAEAWSIGGPARAMHPLARLAESVGELAFALPDSDDDALVWTNGAWLSVVGLQGEATVDPDPPADTGVARPADDGDPVVDARLFTPGGCDTAGGPGAGAWLVAIGVLLGGRRRGR